MDVQTAITQAKSYVADIFRGEGAFNVGLEEIEFNDRSDTWDVTVGFSRPWDNIKPSLIDPGGHRRTYKVVRIGNQDGKIMSVKNRQLARDA